MNDINKSSTSNISSHNERSFGTDARNNEIFSKGQIYEKLVISLLARNGYELSKNKEVGYGNFALGREVYTGLEGKFDDVVFKYESPNNTEQLIFAQIKYKKCVYEIDSRALSNKIVGSKITDYGNMNRDFNLQKYFISYLNIKKILKTTESNYLKNGNIKYLVIFTNSKLNEKELRENGFSLKNAPEDISKLFSIKKTFSCIQEFNHHQLKDVNNELRETFQKSSDLHRIGQKLAYHAISGAKSENIIMKLDDMFVEDYMFALEEEVFDKLLPQEPNMESENSCRRKFKDNFINCCESGPKQLLRDTILEYMRKMLIDSEHETSDDTLKGLLKDAKWILEANFRKYKCKSKTSFIEWDLVEEHDINKFLNSLVFIVNQPEIEYFKSIITELTPNTVLEETILRQLLNKMEGIADLEFTDSLEDTLGIREKPTFEENWISGEEIIDFADDLQQQVSVSFTVTVLTAMYEKEVMQYGRFDELGKFFKDLDNFLKEKNCVILRFFVPNTILGSIKIFQYFKTKKTDNDNIVISSFYLLNKISRDAVVKAFKMKNNNVLTIECSHIMQIEDIQKLYNELSNIIKNDCNKKIIVIDQCDKKNALTEKFKEEFKRQYFTIVDEINLKNFRPLINPFEKEIIFMGQERTTLSKLIGIRNWEDYLNSQEDENNANKLMNFKALTELIINDDINVGSKPLGITDLNGAYTTLCQEINVETLISELSQESNNIYVISGFNESNKTEKFEEFIKCLEGVCGHNLDFIQSTINTIWNNDDDDAGINIIDRIQIYNTEFQEENFKKICHDNTEKTIYWINKENKENELIFILKQFYNPNFYSERQFLKISIIKDAKCLLMKKFSKDIFLFSNIKNKEQLVNQFNFKNNHAKHNFIKKLKSKNTSITFASEENAKSTFKYLCEQMPNERIHWFKAEDQLTWNKTYRPFKTSLINERNLLKEINDEKVVIIADDPGMGKSTTLTKLCEVKYKLRSKSYWIIRINLRNHLKAIKTIDPNDVNVVEFLSQIDPSLNNDLGKYLLQLALDKNKNISKLLLIAFDGFDEILNPEDRNRIIRLLTFLKNETKGTSWITTRKHYTTDLEEALSVFAIEFIPIDNIKKFIENYLEDRLLLILDKNKFHKTFIAKPKISIYSTKFVNKMHQVFKSNELKFMGTPLQLSLMLEGSTEHCKTWIENNFNDNFNHLGSNILEIYQNFIDKKYDFYFRKISTQKQLQQNQDRVIFDFFNKNLAKSLILKTEPNNILEDFKDSILSTGIVIFRNNILEFAQPTFKEYFAAQVFVHWIQKTPNKFLNRYKQEYLLNEILLNPNYKLIRSFINFILENIAKTRKLCNESLKHYGNVLSKLLSESPCIYTEKGTILHAAAQEGNKQIANFIFDCLEQTNDVQQNIYNLLMIRDHIGRTALHHAVIKNNYQISKLILDKTRQNLSGNGLYVFLSATDDGLSNFIYGILGMVVGKKFSKGCELSREQEKILAYNIISKYTHLLNIYDDDEQKHAKLMLYALEMFFLIYKPFTIKGDGKTVLHYAIQNGIDNIIDYILDTAVKMSDLDLSKFLDIEDIMGETAINYVTLYKRNSTLSDLKSNVFRKKLSLTK